MSKKTAKEKVIKANIEEEKSITQKIDSKESTETSQDNVSIAPKPPKNGEGFSLLYHNPVSAQKWIIYLWSNQVVSGLVDKQAKVFFNDKLTYKFEIKEGGWERNQISFYKYEVKSEIQRQQAEDEYAKQILKKIEEGYELLIDSRIEAAKEKARKKATLQKGLPADKIKTMSALELFRYWGSQYHEISKSQFKKALKENVKRYKTLPESADFESEYRWDADSFDFDEMDCSHDVFKENVFELAQLNFDRLMIVKYSLKDEPKLLEINKSINIGHWQEEDGPESGYYFFHGDVHIKGDLYFGTHLYISGDLVVDGVIYDNSEWTSLSVGGNIKAAGIAMGSQMFCAGEISTPFCAIGGTGEILVGQQLKTKLFVENGYMDHSIPANLNAEYCIIFSEQDDAIQQLEKVLIPEVIDKLKEDSKQTAIRLNDDNEELFYFDKKIILDYIRKGKNIWK